MTAEMTPETRNRLLSAVIKNPSETEAPPLAFAPDTEFEFVKIEGWRFQFVPAKGPFAGQPITRTFVVPSGTLGAAKRTCRNRYGEAAYILAGRALHLDSKFGDWDD